ncbi:hypothetical protein PCL_08347 [Purpureocillium lilacinum]|uniref:RNA polymerase II holoenzyme cyclin-like subunit n=1 Tax=Purpureocillium lilacinum TaxID=33203 RepID=A0A2U3DRV4_PURLI|nr:hypothetical protein PCL_08347 [Purpureocillium lilacinum]
MVLGLGDHRAFRRRHDDSRRDSYPLREVRAVPVLCRFGGLSGVGSGSHDRTRIEGGFGGRGLLGRCGLATPQISLALQSVWWTMSCDVPTAPRLRSHLYGAAEVSAWNMPATPPYRPDPGSDHATTFLALRRAPPRSKLHSPGAALARRACTSSVAVHVSAATPGAMSANYWESTQRRQWLFTKDQLASMRQKLEDNNADLIHTDPPPTRVPFVIPPILIRQQAMATAQVYLKRFYSRVEIRYTNSYLVATASVYLACKIEEAPRHIELIVTEARQLWPRFIGLDTGKLGECEFYIVSEMSSQLIVHQPYRTLKSLCRELSLHEGDVQLARSIINDHYMTDLPLLCPPHIIAMVAILLALILRAYTVPGGSLFGSSADTGPIGAYAALSLAQTRANGLPTPSPRIVHSKERQQEARVLRVQLFAAWLAESDVDIAVMVDAMQEIISLYGFRDQYNDKFTQEQINRFVNARDLAVRRAFERGSTYRGGVVREATRCLGAFEDLDCFATAPALGRPSWDIVVEPVACPREPPLPRSQPARRQTTRDAAVPTNWVWWLRRVAGVDRTLSEFPTPTVRFRLRVARDSPASAMSSLWSSLREGTAHSGIPPSHMLATLQCGLPPTYYLRSSTTPVRDLACASQPVDTVHREYCLESHPLAYAHFQPLKNKSTCLIIVHPVDEAMFVAPTLLSLTRPQTDNHGKVLCLSTGCLFQAATNTVALTRADPLCGVVRPIAVSVATGRQWNDGRSDAIESQYRLEGPLCLPNPDVAYVSTVLMFTKAPQNTTGREYCIVRGNLFSEYTFPQQSSHSTARHPMSGQDAARGTVGSPALICLGPACLGLFANDAELENHYREHHRNMCSSVSGGIAPTIQPNPVLHQYFGDNELRQLGEDIHKPTCQNLARALALLMLQKVGEKYRDSEQRPDRSKRCISDTLAPLLLDEHTTVRHGNELAGDDQHTTRTQSVTREREHVATKTTCERRPGQGSIWGGSPGVLGPLHRRVDEQFFYQGAELQHQQSIPHVLDQAAIQRWFKPPDMALDSSNASIKATSGPKPCSYIFVLCLYGFAELRSPLLAGSRGAAWAGPPRASPVCEGLSLKPLPTSACQAKFRSNQPKISFYHIHHGMDLDRILNHPHDRCGTRRRSSAVIWPQPAERHSDKDPTSQALATKAAATTVLAPSRGRYAVRPAFLDAFNQSFLQATGHLYTDDTWRIAEEFLDFFSSYRRGEHYTFQRFWKPTPSQREICTRLEVFEAYNLRFHETEKRLVPDDYHQVAMVRSAFWTYWDHALFDLLSYASLKKAEWKGAAIGDPVALERSVWDAMKGRDDRQILQAVRLICDRAREALPGNCQPGVASLSTENPPGLIDDLYWRIDQYGKAKSRAAVDMITQNFLLRILHQECLKAHDKIGQRQRSGETYIDHLFPQTMSAAVDGADRMRNRIRYYLVIGSRLDALVSRLGFSALVRFEFTRADLKALTDQELDSVLDRMEWCQSWSYRTRVNFADLSQILPSVLQFSLPSTLQVWPPIPRWALESIQYDQLCTDPESSLPKLRMKQASETWQAEAGFLDVIAADGRQQVLLTFYLNERLDVDIQGGRAVQGSEV